MVRKNWGDEALYLATRLIEQADGHERIMQAFACTPWPTELVEVVQPIVTALQQQTEKDTALREHCERIRREIHDEGCGEVFNGSDDHD